jgi:osmotically-inducible protein OsmY
MARNRDNYGYGRSNRDESDMDRRNQRNMMHDERSFQHRDREWDRGVDHDRDQRSWDDWEQRDRHDEFRFRDRNDWNRDRDVDRNRSLAYFTRDDDDYIDRPDNDMRYQEGRNLDRYRDDRYQNDRGMNRFGSHPSQGSSYPRRHENMGSQFNRFQDRNFNRSFEDRGYGDLYNERGFGGMNRFNERGNQSMGFGGMGSQYSNDMSGQYSSRMNDPRNFQDRWNQDRDRSQSFGHDMNESMRENRNRGPKGYQRSDERVREDISDRLMHQSNIDASDVEIKVQNGDVTLTGTVQNKQHKRMIEDISECVMGVKDVTNQIRVSRGENKENVSTTSPTAGSSVTTNRNNNTTSSSRSRNDAE